MNVTVSNGRLTVLDGFGELVIENDLDGRIRFTVLHACVPVATVTAAPEAAPVIAAFLGKENL